MASDKKEKKLEILLDGLTKGKLSLVDIANLVSTNRSNSYNLLNELMERGYEIRKEVDGKRVSYYISEDVPVVTHISKNTLNKYTILNVLSRPERFSRARLVKFFEDSNENEPSVVLKKSRLYELIHELLRDKEIYMDGEILRISPNHKAELLSFNSLEELYSLYYRINQLDKDSDEFKALENLNNKLSMLIGNIDQSSFPSEHYIVTSKASFDMGAATESVSSLSATNFKQKVVKITYQTKNKGERTIPVGIGMTVFSPAKNRVFILGFRYDEGKNEFPQTFMEIIPVDTVSMAENTEYDNPFYMDDFFKAQYNEMFLVSSENARPVEIEFDKEPRIQKRLVSLLKHRTGASLKASESKLYYSDSVSGMSDLISYVNTFTDSANIISPKKVKEDQKISIQKTLKRYGEV